MSDMLFGGPAPPSDEPRMPARLRVLIAVKAAPNPSSHYGETVCVAGLRLDAGVEGWVRLYPINFRHIETNHAFKKYDVVTVDAQPASEGRRESWRPQVSTLEVVAHLDGWDRRMPHLRPFVAHTMCEMNRQANDGGPSLGLVAVREVKRLDIEAHPGWTLEEQRKIDAFVAQGELFDFGRPKSALEPPRFRGYYNWRCTDPSCPGHRQGILDWEFVAFQRRLAASDEAAVASIRRRWLEELCAPTNEVFFYVGNQAKRRHVFSVLGVVYPKK